MGSPGWDQAFHVVLLLLFMSAGAVALIAGIAPLMFPDAPKTRLANPTLARVLVALALVGLVIERIYHTL